MPLDFPTSPTNGQYYNGFVYNAANETWDSAYAPRAATVPITSPNYIINGAFDINQRNFTSTTTSNSYGFDRWRLYFSGGTATYSAQQFTPGTAPSAAVEGTNFARIVTSGQSTPGSYSILNQQIEGVRNLAGQTTTVSFWAKAASGTPKVAIELGQVFGSGGSASPQVLTYGGNVTLSTSWARYSVTVTLPSISGKTIAGGDDSLYLFLFTSAGSDLAARTGSIGIQNNTIDFWGVQVEQGAAATEFRRNAPSIQAELAACQRYYFRNSYMPGAGECFYGIAATRSGSSSTLGTFNLPVEMRAVPTISMSGIAFKQLSGGSVAMTNTPIYNPSTKFSSSWEMARSTGTWPGESFGFLFGGVSSYIDYSAEL